MQTSADRILVVEDENIARRNLEHILKKVGLPGIPRKREGGRHAGA